MLRAVVVRSGVVARAFSGQFVQPLNGRGEGHVRGLDDEGHQKAVFLVQVQGKQPLDGRTCHRGG